MSEPRWTLRWHRGTGWIDPAGWVVCDRGKRVSVPWGSRRKAERQRDAIAALYARWGW